VAASPIRHVLFDADGVLQDVPGGWEAGAKRYPDLTAHCPMTTALPRGFQRQSRG
jgi:hypothetical protein